MKEEGQKAALISVHNISPYYPLPWLFQHKELLTSTTTERPWDQKKLVNKLNHLNFIDSYVFILCHHQQTDEHFLLKAYPQPCVKDELICILDPTNNLIDFTEYNLDYLMLDDGLTAILAPVKLISTTENTLKLNLPDEIRITKTRKTRRYYCDDISCEVTQDGFNARGILIDFTPSAMGIKLTRYENIKDFDENKTTLINFYQDSSKIFSCSFHCIRNGINSPDGKIIFEPLETQKAIFPKREMRNPRQSITPSFVISFKHPFIPLNLELDVIDISNSGFSVREQSEEETLLPGIIISNVFIIFAGIVNMPCSVQVIYRQLEQDNNIVKIGIVITDMDLKAFSYLNHILGAHIDKNARISTEINIEKLWEFFFDAGFIYGAKYEHLHSYRQTFRETYRKLYLDNPNIARHFIYEKNGKIYGHIAMVHAYKPSWIIHHFTALSIGGRLPSFTVLKQIIQFTGSYSRLPSSGMDHVMTYYQPENKVIDKIFGGFTHQIKDAQKSSVDVFSYIFFKKYHPINKLPKDWLLTESKSIDFVKLKEFYKLSSGGLLTSALGLDSSSASITKSFADAGFRRNYKSYCLYYKEEQIAFFIVNQSDLGLNLSDLLNGIKIIVFDKDKLPWHIFLDSVNNLSGFFTEENIPLLIFPSDYLRSQNISEEKQYALWILLSIYGDDYLKYMNKLIRL